MSLWVISLAGGSLRRKWGWWCFEEGGVSEALSLGNPVSGGEKGEERSWKTDWL